LSLDRHYGRDESFLDNAHSSLVAKVTAPQVCLREITMGKAKKRVAARRKNSRCGTANTKPARRTAAKRAAQKTAKTKTRRGGIKAKKPALKNTVKNKQPAEAVEANAAAMPADTAAMDMTEKLAPGTVDVTEHESVQMTPLISSEVRLKRGEDISPSGTSP
jgi:hypothetical protein